MIFAIKEDFFGIKLAIETFKRRPPGKLEFNSFVFQVMINVSRDVPNGITYVFI